MSNVLQTLIACRGIWRMSLRYSIFFSGCLFLCFVSNFCWAQVSNQATASSSLCASEEHTVFSCVLNNNKKKVSLCASSDLSHFYYVYGRDGKPELIFPPKDDSTDNPFMRTYLHFMGNTGGYTYSFINDNFKYIIYSISGSHNYEAQGLIVQRVSDMRAIQDMSCQRASVVESSDHALRNITLKWPHDAYIDEHNLPHTR